MQKEITIIENGPYSVRIPDLPTSEYVRVVCTTAEYGEIECVYWDCNEWKEDPAGVMGVIMSAIRMINCGYFKEFEELINTLKPIWPCCV